MNIIFLFSGQSRTSPFSHNLSMSNLVILESYNKYIFTQKFKSMYNYKIYITTDDIHLSNTINYFQKDNIGNIHLLNTDAYLKTPIRKSHHINTYLSNYNKKDWSTYQKYDNSIYQHYKIMDCYNLYKNDADIHNELNNCDYIVRIRLDVIFNMDIIDMLSKFTLNPEIELLTHWDLFAIGKPKIMTCYCNGLNNNYGNYNYQVKAPDIPSIMVDYNNVDKCRWTYAPERQLFEMLFEYANNNNLTINKAIIPISCCTIVR